MNWIFCKIKVRPSYSGGLSEILLSVLTSSKKLYLSLQVATEIGIGSFLLSELLPALRNIFASIAAASVVYEVIDQVSICNYTCH